MGAKVFEREGDLDIAAKLTEGCVWAYNSTRTGIMPESFRVVPCASREECAWNETRWWDFLDPYAHNREEVYEAKVERFHLKAATEKADDAKPSKSAHAVPQIEIGDGPSKAEKRRVKRKAMETDRPQADKVPSKTTSPNEQYENSILVEPPPPSHEEYVQARIEDERLPPGFTRIYDGRYILRYVKLRLFTNSKAFVPILSMLTYMLSSTAPKRSNPSSTCTGSRAINTGARPDGVCLPPSRLPLTRTTATAQLTTLPRRRRNCLIRWRVSGLQKPSSITIYYLATRAS